MTTEYIPPECCSGWNITAAACIVVADFVTANFQLKNKYDAKQKYDKTTEPAMRTNRCYR